MLRKRCGCNCDQSNDPPCTGTDCPSWITPLDQAIPGCRFRVQRISGGRHLCARMAAMGIYPGAELELLCAGCDAPCVVRVKGGKLSLGKGISEKILVSPSSSPDG